MMEEVSKSGDRPAVAPPAKGRAMSERVIFSKVSSPFNDSAYRRKRSAQYVEDRQSLENLRVSENYVAGVVNIFLPFIIDGGECGIGAADRNGYAVLKVASTTVAVECTATKNHPFHSGYGTDGANWYDLDVSVVIGNPSEFPKKPIASRIGFFVGDEVRKLRSEKLLKSLSFFPSLEEDFAEVFSTGCEGEVDLLHQAARASVASGRVDSDVLKGAPQIIKSITDMPRDCVWKWGGTHEAEMLISSFDICLFDHSYSWAIEERATEIFCFFDVLVGLV
jgi:hypothetical protein